MALRKEALRKGAAPKGTTKPIAPTCTKGPTRSNPRGSHKPTVPYKPTSPYNTTGLYNTTGPYNTTGLYNTTGPYSTPGPYNYPNPASLLEPTALPRDLGASKPGALAIPALLSAFILSLFLLLTPPQPLSAYSSEPDFLLAEFWVELVPAVDEPYGASEGGEDGERDGSARGGTAFEGEIFPMQAAPLPRKEAVRRLLEEAIFVFSGMIYGFELDYTPLDRNRQVAEHFSADPVAQIPWGDPGLQVQETWRIKAKLYARIRYDLNPDQLRRREAWSSAVHEAASGSAIAPLNLGYKGRMEAHRLAIKEAFRSHLRSIERNKPRSTRGRCVIAEAPITALSAGGYRSTIRLRLEVEEVNPYR